MADIEKLEERRKELDRRIRAARRAEAAKVAEEEARYYTALGRAVAERFGGDAVSVEARSAAARERLDLPAAPQAKKRGRPAKKEQQQAAEAEQVRPEQHVQPAPARHEQGAHEPAQQHYAGQEPAPHQFGG